MKITIKFISRDKHGQEEVLVIAGAIDGNKTSDLKKLWDVEHLINEHNSYLRCHIEVVE